MNAQKIEFLKKKFGINKSSEKTIVEYLLEIPKKEKYSPITDVFKTNNTHQIDLLFLPDDNNYKYALVCVDLGYPRYIGTEKLQSKSADDVKNALLNIYKKNKYLEVPKILECDDGTEFKAEFKTYFNNNGVFIRYKKAGRHRQQACVESVNGVLVHYLFYNMLANEINLKSKEIIGDWVDNLIELTNLLNYMKSKLPKNKPITKSKRNIITDNGKWLYTNPKKTTEIIPVNTKVRVILDEPRDIQGTKQNGTFRKGDIRWNNKIDVIENLSLRPNQPPMYLIKDINNVAYTKEQLQVVKDNEKPPNKETITRFNVENILKKRKNKNNKIEYLVKFENYKDPEWTEEIDIPKNLIDAFNKIKK